MKLKPNIVTEQKNGLFIISSYSSDEELRKSFNQFITDLFTTLGEKFFSQHPDYFELTPEKNSYQVEEIAELQKFHLTHPIQAPLKISVLTKLSALKDLQANKCLKLFEDIPDRHYIFALNPGHQKVLPTLKSRAHEVHLHLQKKNSPHFWSEIKNQENWKEHSQGLHPFDREDSFVEYWSKRPDDLKTLLKEFLSTSPPTGPMDHLKLSQWQELETHWHWNSGAAILSRKALDLIKIW